MSRPTPTQLKQRPADWRAWMIRIFRTPEAYIASLPNRLWELGDGGWTSRERDSARMTKRQRENANDD